MTFQLIATCAKQLEPLLLKELNALGASDSKLQSGAVTFQGSLELAYKSCLWSRLANRILLELHSQKVNSLEEFKTAITAIDWLEHFDCNHSMAVDFTGQALYISNTLFGAQLVKDMVVDQFRERMGERPSIDLKQPDVRLNVRLHRGLVRISIDLSGESLHQRKYRQTTGEAPLKENLAAAILLQSGWQQLAEAGATLYDPMCGSGTLLIEGAMIAGNLPPGLNREYFGFLKWKGHDPEMWGQIRSDAKTKWNEGLKNIPAIKGTDQDSKVIRAAIDNIMAAGLEDFIFVSRRDIRKELDWPSLNGGNNLIISNPPYGERLSDSRALQSLYEQIGKVVKQKYQGSILSLLSSDEKLMSFIGFRPFKKNRFYNGNLKCSLYQYEVHTEGERIEPMAHLREPVQMNILNEQEVMLFSRLKKNHKKLKKWLKKEKISCYRLYDRDLPEYAFALDFYHEQVVMQEYVAPKTVDANKSQKRWKEAVRATRCFVVEHLGMRENNIFFKQRSRQRGLEQYNRIDSHNQMIEVKEGKAKLLVNLQDYLDTGLFLDHRVTRQKISELAKDKSFLNLFAYTGTATVYAALGGCTHSLTVDMSNTYQDWSRQNFELNNLNLRNHQLVQKDCMQFISRCTQRFDLIFLDPPSFSNSKRMKETLDIQRDHVEILTKVGKLLNPEGLLIFSTNRRGFKLDAQQLTQFRVEDKTHETLPMDFQRGGKIHLCWFLYNKA